MICLLSAGEGRKSGGVTQWKSEDLKSRGIIVGQDGSGNSLLLPVVLFTLRGLDGAHWLERPSCVPSC